MGQSSPPRAVPQRYYLLPFRFHRLPSGREVLTNEFGDYLICDNGTARAITDRSVESRSRLYEDLIARFFISESPVPDLLDVLATRYLTKKAFLGTFAYLHILVLTQRCNQRCLYCQASQKDPTQVSFDMSSDDLAAAVRFMFRSPSPCLTMEFQGGEPLLTFDHIRFAVEYAEELNRDAQRTLRYVLCSNLSLLDESILTFLQKHHFLVSTSLDGPEELHNWNRRSVDPHAFSHLRRNIARCREALGADAVSALSTITRHSLANPEKLVDAYLEEGFHNLFIRALNPYGHALTNHSSIGYSAQEFVAFYRRALQHIISLNLRGTWFVEEYARVLLSKILTPFAHGFTDLQSPNGAVCGVLVYNYDGFVYASDESRMLAAQGDTRFRLGHVQNGNYSAVVRNVVAQQIVEDGTNESLPGCSECGFMTYCGADPIRNYSTGGDMVGYRPSNDFCVRNRGIIEFLFELIEENQDNRDILLSWVAQMGTRFAEDREGHE